jgi:hypothetical protein
MGNSALIYKKKFESALHEAEIHVQRMDAACSVLRANYDIPVSSEDFDRLVQNDEHLAFADQMIYRFSKAQDCIGNKLFKAFLLYQGENVDRPFLDILNNLEKIKLLSVDTWFELREIRNEIAHDYEDSKTAGKNIINGIISYKDELKRIVSLFKQIG